MANSKKSLRNRLQELALLAVATAVALAVLEAGLRAFTVFPISADSNQLAHPELGYTLNPSLPDVDAAGFRNVSCELANSPFVTIGDSHTYGNNVSVDENFPSRLAQLVDRCVYNFGVGSYGIFQYGVLLSDLARTHVESVVVALYPANDLRTNAVTCRLTTNRRWQAFSATHGVALPDCGEPTPLPSYAPSLLERTATYQALDYFADDLAHDNSALVNPLTHFLLEGAPPVDKSSIRRHLRQTSLEHADVEANFSVSKAMFRAAQRELTDASIDLAVLIIPSKERAVHAWAAQRAAPMEAEFAAIVASEIALTEAYAAFFAAEGIAHADALSDVLAAMDATLEADQPFYRLNDGHPYAEGYAAYAKSAARLLAGTEH